ncbi:MAG: hypothetical protein K2Q12_08820, partial [Rickettsiales bacterium]|nr:hypothetical protein [Rickettsiales bacterium]
MTHETFPLNKATLSEAARLVIKTGSSLVIDTASGTERSEWMESLAADIAQCRAAGQQVILVSSGA